MSAICFVDTNVLVYARDASEGEKQIRASGWLERLWDQRTGRTGFQVLNEYFVTVTRKLDPGLGEDEAWSDVEDLFAWSPVAVDSVVLRQARKVAGRYGFSWWDAQIVAAAQISGSRYLLTEDLQAGQDVDGLKVVNPFALSANELEATDDSESLSSP